MVTTATHHLRHCRRLCGSSSTAARGEEPEAAGPRLALQGLQEDPEPVPANAWLKRCLLGNTKYKSSVSRARAGRPVFPFLQFLLPSRGTPCITSPVPPQAHSPVPSTVSLNLLAKKLTPESQLTLQMPAQHSSPGTRTKAPELLSLRLLPQGSVTPGASRIQTTRQGATPPTRHLRVHTRSYTHAHTYTYIPTHIHPHVLTRTHNTHTSLLQGPSHRRTPCPSTCSSWSLSTRQTPSGPSRCLRGPLQQPCKGAAEGSSPSQSAAGSQVEAQRVPEPQCPSPDQGDPCAGLSMTEARATGSPWPADTCFSDASFLSYVLLANSSPGRGTPLHVTLTRAE